MINQKDKTCFVNILPVIAFCLAPGFANIVILTSSFIDVTGPAVIVLSTEGFGGFLFWKIYNLSSVMEFVIHHALGLRTLLIRSRNSESKCITNYDISDGRGNI